MKPSRIPDSFNAKPIGYPRWLVLEAGRSGKPTGRLFAIVSGNLAPSQVSHVVQSLSDSLGERVLQVEEHRGPKGTRPSLNPTLVHHGKAKKASHHIVTGDAGRSAIADLYYVGDDTARKIAQAIANLTKLNLVVFNNEKLTHSLEDHPGTFVDSATRKRRNPDGAPTVGEVWTTLRGGRCKVLEVTRSRVRVLHMETGHREWIDLPEFFASYSLKTRLKHNPSRSKAARTRRKSLRSGINRKTHRAATAASRLASKRGAKPGTAARAIHYLEASRARAKRRNPAKKRARSKPSRRPGVSKKRQNPRSVSQRAQATFRKWHEFDSSKVTRMKGPGRVIPKTLVKLGDLVAVTYRSDKYTGKPTLYEHETKRPHPVLASDPDGRHVHIIGGRMKITADGLVN